MRAHNGILYVEWVKELGIVGKIKLIVKMKSKLSLCAFHMQSIGSVSLSTQPSETKASPHNLITLRIPSLV